MKKVILVTDGACIGNPGPGGWACVLRFNQHAAEMFGCEPRTTNNRMELQAVIEGLNALKEPCEVHIQTDSEYVKKGVTEWMKNWKRNGWRRRTREGRFEPVANQELWEQLDAATSRHQLKWEWVRGHAGHSDNERCDELANTAARKQISSGGLKPVS